MNLDILIYVIIASNKVINISITSTSFTVSFGSVCVAFECEMDLIGSCVNNWSLVGGVRGKVMDSLESLT